MLIASFSTPKAPATRAGRVELHHRPDNYHPWITGWRGTDDGVTFDSSWCWGHYFHDEAEARADFAERCKRGY